MTISNSNTGTPHRTLRLAPASLGGEAQRDPSPSRRFGLLAIDANYDEPPQGWLIEGLWPEDAVGFIGGPPKAGKSWLGLDLAISVACGIPFLGQRTNRSGPVLFFPGEESRPSVVARLAGLLKGHGLGLEALGNRLLVASEVPCLEDPSDRQALLKIVDEVKPLLVVIDPLERFLRDGDTNSSKEMRPITSFWRQDITRKCKASVCVIHHTPKKGGSLRGTGDFRAVSEVTLMLDESKSRRVKVETEMRAAIAPYPFWLTLEPGPNGSMAWRRAESGFSPLEKQDAALELLSRVGQEGITLENARKELKVRGEKIRPLLEAVGAAPNGPNGRWVLPEPSLLAA